MSLNNGHLYKTPTTLSKAMEMITSLPTSVELQENFICFKNQEQNKIRFHRFFYNKWDLEIPVFQKRAYIHTLRYKFLTLNIVQVIVINFFQGYYLNDLLSNFMDKKTHYSELNGIIKQLRRRLEHYIICQYCNNYIKSIEQEQCEYCGVGIDWSPILFPNIFK
ncbi:MAG: hypothetical protein ACFFDN_50640 [Candidatus Hodarchaeota archaeon]